MFEKFKKRLREKARAREVLWGYFVNADVLKEELDYITEEKFHFKKGTCLYEIITPYNESLGIEKVPKNKKLNEIINTYVKQKSCSVVFEYPILWYTFGEMGHVVFESDKTVNYRPGFWWSDKGMSLYVKEKLIEANVLDKIKFLSEE
ncbi:hypothetical protein GF374_00710 [Candidatus Woesearchaeota archaeon]|nr:hypothetical protein [Candidatus Woesearchaeota archaeon]